MNWLRAVERLRTERRAGVLVTITSVRGHAPREAGAKMVVGADDEWDTVGGGNLEATAIEAARTMIAGGAVTPESVHVRLTDKAEAVHGRQCCGGEVDLLLEPLPVVPAVAIFGVGHVGLELARILARHDLELHLVDSRAAHLEPQRLTPLGDAIARIHVHHAPVPEMALSRLPDGCRVLIMTHDHAEDAALCDMALRSPRLGPIGLIGSSAKWSRFRKTLAAEGHSPETLARITTPIGLRDVLGKSPATIAVSVAADLVRCFAPAPAMQDVPR
ncbi:xanthine dehydrogenase accessory protein XdhC [Humibacillus sp. DSM 29435]|uniref:xanthine dehydrogenase accessory protein XdhC n=1 Tax=Humibacillus sp. DSM 29435 TaxID=1869167 RepID=UPI00087344F4|nr:xanthine dehydrogenase accessory protein XdhC [Humibacillus sp. DSM 29435]OFE17502.1 xanthine dehydrogenase accessory protein XdhC [Humibacillus sp. DSM 29435]